MLKGKNKGKLIFSTVNVKDLEAELTEILQINDEDLPQIRIL